MAFGLLKLLIASAAVWAILQYAALPRLERAPHESVRRASFRAALEFLRMLAFVATVTYAGVALVVSAVGLSPAAIDALASWSREKHEALEKFAGGWSLLLLSTLGAALALTYARIGGGEVARVDRERAEAERARAEEHARSEFERINALRMNNELDESRTKRPNAEDYRAKWWPSIRILDHENAAQLTGRPTSDAATKARTRRSRICFIADTIRRMNPLPPAPPEPEIPPAQKRGVRKFVKWFLTSSRRVFGKPRHPSDARGRASGDDVGIHGVTTVISRRCERGYDCARRHSR